MDYAKEVDTGKVVAATDASSWRSYSCPRPECAGRVYLAQGRIQRVHFRHYPGEGSDACEEYFPSSGSETAVAPRPLVAVEDEPAALGLVLSELDGHWALCLRIPEISREEFGAAALATLRSALIDVFAGQHLHIQVSALDLRPGVGAARVGVPPSLQEYRSQPVGAWPATIDRQRWHLQSRRLEATGTLFRLRHGEWTRLLSDSGVHQGETLMVLADRRCPPPTSIPSKLHFQTNSGGMQWAFWEVLVPDDLDSAGGWLARMGHSLVPRPWRLTLVTPSRGFTEDGDPVFWLGDVATLKIEAPWRSSTVATLFRAFESNTQLTPVTTNPEGASYATIEAPRPGLSRLSVGGDARSSIDVHFVGRPARSLLESLDEMPKLRVWVGEKCLTAWGEPRYAISVPRSVPLEIHADLGHETARARVTVWQHGLRRSHRGLSPRDIARVLEVALSAEGVSLIEIDADGFGRLEIAPTTVATTVGKEFRRIDRLGWRDLLVAQLPSRSETNVPVVLELPRVSSVRVMRAVTAATLVRARLSLRERRRRGDSLR